MDEWKIDLASTYTVTGFSIDKINIGRAWFVTTQSICFPYQRTEDIHVRCHNAEDIGLGRDKHA